MAKTPLEVSNRVLKFASLADRKGRKDVGDAARDLAESVKRIPNIS